MRKRICERAALSASKERHPITKVSCEVEYNALREEKIFRYGYSNSVNTTLLTITLTVFSVGALLFSIDNEEFICLAKIFFPLFFLLPCFFARICFRSLLRNSVRIGLLSEYIRVYIKFQNDSSWEELKKEDSLNYFMSAKQYIGGVKEVPLCVTVVSLLFSAAITHYFIFETVKDKPAVCLLLCLPIIALGIFFFPINNSKNRKAEIQWVGLLLAIEYMIFAAFFHHLEAYRNIIIIQAVYHMFLIVVFCIIPNFNREVEETNTKLAQYKRDIQKFQNRKVANEK